MLQPQGRFLICSDSLSAIQSLQSFKCDDLLVLRTQELFHTPLSSEYEIGVVWIPGHVGIPGNEAVDAAARAGALNGSQSRGHGKHGALPPCPPSAFMSLMSLGRVFHKRESKIVYDDEYNDVLCVGERPEDFTETVLLPVPKKNDAKKCNEFRTTSLISHSAKILLRILNLRLHSKMEEQLEEEQFGLRKGKDTRDAIGLLQTISERYLEKNTKMCIVFVDLKKTFYRDLVKNCFQNMGEVIIGGRRMKCIRFADDMALLAEEEMILRDILVELNDSCEQYGMKINANKTKTMVIGRKIKKYVILRRFINVFGYLTSEWDEGDNAGEMSPGSSTESYPGFAHIGLRENPGKNLNQVDGIGDSDMVFGEMRPRIRHRLPDILLTIEENLGKSKPGVWTPIRYRLSYASGSVIATADYNA
ncbi:hypothetical protein ANN_01269 [Periplaneta americana]|uniref:RNase H type-1 domain-containing protein n=1 Tax=Periplaneta americana TaxID=6978 RepID=A0ABQ8TT30_PERAM|nr:hypothetical protein ANN_01269 [Periplaneta americana]